MFLESTGSTDETAVYQSEQMARTQSPRSYITDSSGYANARKRLVPRSVSPPDTTRQKPIRITVEDRPFPKLYSQHNQDIQRMSSDSPSS